MAQQGKRLRWWAYYFDNASDRIPSRVQRFSALNDAEAEKKALAVMGTAMRVDVYRLIITVRKRKVGLRIKLEYPSPRRRMIV